MESVVVTIIVITIVGMFFDFFGLGTLWTNRGSWYMVMPDELETVISNLHKLHAFEDSDGIPNGYIKIKAYYANSEMRYYRVRVPNWVFKYEQKKLTDQTKASMLGINL